jgi:hypothetical protein
VFGKADNNMYFEDNIFTGVDIIMDCQEANRYVFRYNNITNYNDSFPLFDYHGNDGAAYSSFGGEVYGNQITDNYGMGLMAHRGGKLLLFMNNNDGPSTWYMSIYNEFPDSANPSINPSPQYPNDSYYFLNRKNRTGTGPGVAVLMTVNEPPLTNVPTENREFFVGTDSFNGTKGVGYGPLSARPSTCTVGVGYWATDLNTADLTGMVGKAPAHPISGTLYKCTAPNVWTAYYTPYTYPHPLRTLLSD